MSLQKIGRIGLLVVIAMCVAGCGSGGSSSDVVPGEKAGVTPTDGPDSFLLFPNPQKQDDGTLQVASAAYATAYYEAVDPNNERDTLAKFKAKNGFGTAGGTLGEVQVIIGDQRDLGYGRRMTGRQNADGTLAFVVENYLVGAYGAYSPLNLEAAIYPEAKWHLGTNGIEFSPGYDANCTAAPRCSTNFVKFYTFDPITGVRLSTVNLDGRGYKAMPTVCATCHGGRGDPLTPAAGSSTGKALFAKLMNAASKADYAPNTKGGVRGDMGAQLHPFEPASFDFSTIPAFTRAMQEANIKTINKMVLCSMPNPGASAGDDACRRTATFDEYQGTAATHLKDMYGGAATTLANATSNAADTYVEADWLGNGQSNLYLNTEAKSCRVCHLLRGTGNQSDIDFETFTKFDGYSERIKAHVLDRGNMPLSKLINNNFWATPSTYNAMATYLTSKGYTGTSTAPGRPVADPGPTRIVRATSVGLPANTTPLSADMSLYSTGYQWSIVTEPVGGATITNATSSHATLNTTGDGTYTLRLITSRGATQSTPVNVDIIVDAAAFDARTLRFTDIKALLQAGGGGCTGCHTTNGGPPIWYIDIDRNGNGGVEATNNKTDDDNHWFYTELRGRINFTDIVASPLLRKPSNHHHAGGLRPGFDDTLTPGAAGRVDYDKFLGWILNGAPE